MGTTSEKLQAALESKQDVQSALEEQGLEVTDDFSTYGNMVRTLENTSDATATASEILEGTTAYTANGKVTGTFSPIAANISYDNSASGLEGTTTQAAIDENAADIADHIADKENPHAVTAAQVGAIPTTEKGAASGVAELDENGIVLAAQLPSYVDDVLEYTTLANFPSTGETGKIYVATTTGKTYRWSGSGYTEISASIALGETATTAYRGDRGKIAYQHVSNTENPHQVTPEQIGLTTETWTFTLEDGSTVTKAVYVG